jgi:hypothetical protein
MVRTIAKELIDQIAVCGVDLDAVEAGPQRVAGGATIVVDEFRDLLGAKASWNDMGQLPLVCVRQTRCCDHDAETGFLHPENSNGPLFP